MSLKPTHIQVEAYQNGIRRYYAEISYQQIPSTTSFTGSLEEIAASVATNLKSQGLTEEQIANFKEINNSTEKHSPYRTLDPDELKQFLDHLSYYASHSSNWHYDGATGTRTLTR